MSWFRKREPKWGGVLDRVDPKVLIGAAYPSAIVRVRDLERIGNDKEARELFDPVIQAVSMLWNHPDGLGVMFNALDEVIARRRYDLIPVLEQAIRKSPRLLKPDGAALRAGLDEVLVYARNREEVAQLTFYACQRCGSMIFHITEPCPICLFLSTCLEEACLSTYLSSAAVSPFKLPSIGSRIRLQGVASVEEIRGFDASTQMEDSAAKNAAHFILDRCRSRNVVAYRALDSRATCRDCGKESDVSWWSRQCKHCGSREVLLPPARLYKIVVRDCLVWLQDIVRPDENRCFVRLVYDLARLQELACFEGKFVAKEEGYAIKHNMDRLGTLHSPDGRYEIVFDPQEVSGRFVTE
jgi:Zn finger protein HypA/HybF involved in hydrogenase expression